MPSYFSKIRFHSDTIIFAVILLAVSFFLLPASFGFFSFPAYILLMTPAFLLSFLRPRAGIFSIFVLLMIFGWVFALTPIVIEERNIKIFPVDVLFLGTLLGTFRLFFSGKVSFSPKKTDFLIILFLFFVAVYFFLSFFDSESSFQLAFSSFKNYAFYPLLFFVSAALFQKPGDRERFFRVFLFGAILIIGFVFYGVLAGGGAWVEITPLSTSGTRILSFYQAFYLSLAFLGFLAFSADWKNRSGIFLKLATLFWILGIVGSLMRHLWIGFLPAVFFLYLFLPEENRRMLKKSLSGYGAVFTGILVFSFYLSSMLPTNPEVSRFNSFGNFVYERVASFSRGSSDESFSWRGLVWGAVLEKYRESPVSGIGFGKKVFVSQGGYRDEVEVRDIHNSPLVILVQLGAVPFLLLFSAVFLILKKSWGARKKIFHWSDGALLASLIFYLAVFMFQPYLELNILSLPFWMILGLLRGRDEASVRIQKKI